MAMATQSNASGTPFSIVKEGLKAYGESAVNFAEILFMDCKALTADIQLLRTLGEIEGGIGGLIMGMIDEIRQMDQKVSSEQKETLCTIISSLFKKLYQALPWGETELVEKEKVCQLLVNEEKLEDLRGHLEGLLHENKLKIVSRELSMEQVSCAISVIGFVNNLHHIFCSLESIQCENKAERDFLQERYLTLKGRFEEIINRQRNDIPSLVQNLQYVCQDLESLVKTIQIKTTQQIQTRNSYYAGAAVSFLRLGFTIARGIAMKGFGILSLSDWLIFGASGAAHIGSGVTCIYIGGQYGQEVSKLRVLLTLAFNCHLRAKQYLQKSIPETGN